MQLVFFLRAAHAEPRLNVDVIVHTIHICIRMMNDVMLHVPHKAVTAEYVQ